MKKLYTLLFGLTLMITTSQAATKTVKHTIKNGETLYTIAHKNHTTIEEVRKVNGLKKGDNLKIGRVLNVPTNTYLSDKKKKVAKKASKKTVKLAKHSIKNGETLYTIARKHHTTIEEVRKVNGLKKGDNLKIGRVIKVPKNTYKVPKSKIVKAKKTKKKSNKLVKHSIKKGETLFTIAKKHHTTIEEVRKANGLKKGANLKIGRVLKVPLNTYNVPKVKIVKTTKKKRIKVAKAKKKTSSKKLVASLSKLETVSLEKKQIKQSNKKADKFVLSDIFFGGTKVDSDKCKKITSDAKKKLGKRYVWGASGTKNTYDCSSFTKYVYRKNGISIPRTSINQSKHGKYVKRSDLKKGDLIFFDTSKRRKGYVNHVGIYLGNNKFIHASSAKKKVVVSSLSKFYGKRYKGARRPS